MKAHSAHGGRIFMVTMDTCIIGLVHFLSAVIQMMMFHSNLKSSNFVKGL